MPSLTELEKLFANKAAINASLNALGVALLEGWYWSSTEYDYNVAWGLWVVGGDRYGSNKYGNRVRSSGSSFKTLIISPFILRNLLLRRIFLSAKFNLKITLDLEVTLRTIFQIVLI